MREPLHRKPATRGELRESGYVSRRTKAELRDNLLVRLRSGTTAFPGIVGFDDTVLPELESAVLAGHDPSTGEHLHHAKNRKVPGWDLTFRAPKSVSILWGLSEPLVG